MKKTIYLKLDTYYGIITIPFESLKDVDDFTVRYENLSVLVTKLIKILGLKIDLYDVENVYLTYDKYNRGLDSSCLFVKYSKDNFNDDSLIDVFCEYLLENPSRIFKNDIRYVKTGGMLEFLNSGKISNFELKNAIRAYFNDEKGYRKKRNTYFFLKDTLRSGNKIKIDSVTNIDDDVVRKSELVEYDPEDDSYLSHLIGLSKNNEKYYDRILEEIGQMDFEEISMLLKNNGYGIVDGVSDESVFLNRDVCALENGTGLTIDELRNNHTSFGRKKGSR